MSQKTWFAIKATATAIDISIHDEIGMWGITAKDFLKELRAQPANLPVNLSIHSPGGEVFDGWAIYNALKARNAPVHVKIEGLAASMASVIAMAGTTITMPENAYMMIHNPWGVAFGEASDMRELADLLDKLRDGILNAYEAQTGMSRDELTALMDAETWMDGKEALERGFIDSTSDTLALAASAFDTRKFLNMPKAALTPKAQDETPDPAPSPTPEDPPSPAVEPPAPAAEPTPEPPAAPVEPPAPAAPEAKGFLARLTAAFSGDDAIRNELATVRATLAQRDAEIATFKALFEAANARALQFDAIEAELKQLEAKQKTLGQQAAEVAASHGLKPADVAALPTPSEPGVKTLTHTQFNALPHAERNAFIRDGGKLTDE